MIQFTRRFHHAEASWAHHAPRRRSSVISLRICVARPSKRTTRKWKLTKGRASSSNANPNQRICHATRRDSPVRVLCRPVPLLHSHQMHHIHFYHTEFPRCRPGTQSIWLIPASDARVSLRDGSIATYPGPGIFLPRKGNGASSPPKALARS